jgi:uncharacterized GH25 family protein
MKRRSLLLLLIVTTVTLGLAHEFWLRPKKFRYTPGEEVKIDLVVGENFTGEPWDLTRHRVEKMEWITTSARKDITNLVKPTKGNNLTYKVAGQGSQLIVMQSNTALIELDAEKFNAYLEEDGIEEIIQRRKDRNETGLGAKEHYQRFSKLLLQSGTTFDDVYKRNVGHPLEIIPESNPSKLKSGDYLACKVLFQGKPLAHQLVKVWNMMGNRAFLQNMYTENDGMIRFPISGTGPWMVSSVKMLPSDDEQVDYKSMWASLVFGVE